MDASDVSWAELSERLSEVAGLLLTADQPDDVLRQVAVLATRTIPAAASCSVTLPGDDDAYTVTAANELARQVDELQYTNGDGPCLAALNQGSAVNVANMAEETRWGEYPQLGLRHGVLSSLSLPLVPAGKTLGALNLYATVAHGFEDETTRALAELFAGQAGVTLAGAQRHGEQVRVASGLRSEVERLLSAERHRAAAAERRRQGLETLIAELTGPLNPRQIAHAAVQIAAATTGATAGALLQRSRKAAGHRLELLAGLNVSDRGRQRLAELRLEEAGPFGPVLTDPDSAVLLRPGETDSDPLLGELVPGRAVAAAALPGHGAVLGVLALTYPPGGEPDAEALGHLLTIGRLAGAGLERARLADAEAAAAAEQESAAQRDALLARASAALVGSVARNRALPTLLQALVPDLADWAATHKLTGNGQLRLLDVRHRDPHQRDAIISALNLLSPTTADEVGVGAMAAHGRTAHYPEVTAEVLAVAVPDPVARDRLADLGIGAMLIVPLIVGGRTLGAVTLARSSGGYTAPEVRLIEQIAGRAAVSWDNSQLYQRERSAALTLQRSLLPAVPPTVPGLQVAARYLAGAAGTEAGGDFYDVIPLDRGRTGLAIGDVTGHGITAAATMGQLRAALRAYALEDHGPAALLTRLNRVVIALGTGVLTTCTYAVYQPTRRELTIGTAGHIPPLLSGPNQPTRYLDLDTGVPLGVDGGGFQETALALPPSSTLVLCTDGLVESRALPLDDGLDQLAAAVDAIKLPPDEVCDHVLRELVPDPDGAADDIALLIATTDPDEETGSDPTGLSR